MKVLFPFLFIALFASCATIPVDTRNLDNMSRLVNNLPDTTPEKAPLKKLIETEKKEKAAIIKENAALNDEVKLWRKIKYISAGLLVLIIAFFTLRAVLRI